MTIPPGRGEPGRSRSTHTVALVLRRPPRLPGFDPFFGEFTDGLEGALPQRGMALLLLIVESIDDEIAAYRRWAKDGTVKAVILVDFVVNDRRPEAIAALGIPAVAVGGPALPAFLSAIRVDNVEPMVSTLEFLAKQGHTTVGRVSGPSAFVDVAARTEAFVDTCQNLGLAGIVEEGDHSAESGRRATAALLILDRPATAIVYDNDLTAIAGMEYAAAGGLQVPRDLSIVAWNDSVLARLTDPPLTTVSHDLTDLAELVSTALLHIVSGGPPQRLDAARQRLTVRGTTASPHPIRT